MQAVALCSIINFLSFFSGAATQSVGLADLATQRRVYNTVTPPDLTQEVGLHRARTRRPPTALTVWYVSRSSQGPLMAAARGKNAVLALGLAGPT